MNASKSATRDSAPPRRASRRVGALFNRDVFLVAVLAVGMLLLILWPRISVTIRPGHVGVFFNRLFGGTDLTRTYGEGLHLFLPWNSITPYDCRLQKENYSIPALAQGGLEVNLEITAIWSVDHNRAALLHIMAGPNYKDRMISPPVISAVRFVIGGFQQEGLYDLMQMGNPRTSNGTANGDGTGFDDARLAQNLRRRILDQARIYMKESISVDAEGEVLHPLHLIDIQIRRIVLPDSLRQAIDDKFVAEQNIFVERYRVLQSYERYKSRYIDSQATRMNQIIVNEGLTENYLRHEGIAATRDLAASRNAKLVLIGGKDGLPLLLNPDSLTQPGDGNISGQAGPGEPFPIADGGDMVKPAPSGPTWNPDYDLLRENLAQLEKMRAEIYPDSVLDRTLPKIDQVGGLSADGALKFFHDEPGSDQENPANATGSSPAAPDPAGATDTAPERAPDVSPIRPNEDGQ